MSIPDLLGGLFKNDSPSDKLISLGLSSVFDTNYRSRTGFEDKELKEIRRNIILCPDILKDFYKSIDTETHLDTVFATAKEFDIDLYSIPFWKSKIDSITTEASIEDMSWDIWADRKDYLLSAARMVPGFDWAPLLKLLGAHQVKCGYIRRSYITAARGLAEADLQEFKGHVDNTVFYPNKDIKRPGYAVRGILYSLYIENGLLTKKTARKIRSDGAEDSSLTGVRALIKHSELYPNSDELLLQFSDSKYEGVVAHLADFLPEYLLTSIMGTQFYWAKRKLEHRLEAIERAKEEAQNNLFLESTEEG